MASGKDVNSLLTAADNAAAHLHDGSQQRTTGNGDMDTIRWSQRRPPAHLPAQHSLGAWKLTARADLTLSRLQLQRRVDEGEQPPGASEDDVDRLLLTYEELASNAVRHGRHPVQVTVSIGLAGWLVDVTDGAPEHPPAPAVNRDPAAGGMGLYLVARLAAAHGWFAEHDRKHVWAWIALSPAT